MPPQPKDLTGKTYARLTVLAYVGGPYARWKVRCDCGTEKNVPGHSLRDGTTTSCGCLRLKYDLTNQRFGKLVALQHIGRGFWSVRCDCGKEFEVAGAQLRNGQIASCGCARKRKLVETQHDEERRGPRGP